MKKKKILCVLTSIALLGGVSGSLLTLASCSGSTEVKKATIVYDYDDSKLTVEKVDSAEVGTEISIKITAKDGYLIGTINGKDVNKAEETYKYTVKESDNKITITAVEDSSLPFTVTEELLLLNLDENKDGIELSSIISWGSNTPKALDVEVYDDSVSFIKYENGKLIPLAVGTGKIKIFVSGKSTNYVDLNFRVIQNVTELEQFNTAGAFSSYDAVSTYFETTGSNRLDEFKFAQDNDARGEQCINLWVEDNISDATKLPKLVLKKTINHEFLLK